MAPRLPLVPVEDSGFELRQKNTDETGWSLYAKPPTFVIGPNVTDVRAVPRRARVWVLLSHFIYAPPSSFLAKLDLEGRRLVTFTRPGSTLALYDLSPRTSS